MAKQHTQQRNDMPEKIIEACTVDLQTETMPSARQRKLQQRLFARVQADLQHTSHTVRALEGRWEIFLPGIQIKVLHQAPDTLSYLLRLEAGAVLPPHHHPQMEECIVLEGSLRTRFQGEDMIVAGRGTFHCAPAEVDHEMITTDTGALIYLRSATPGAAQMNWLKKGAARAVLPMALK